MAIARSFHGSAIVMFCIHSLHWMLMWTKHVTFWSDTLLIETWNTISLKKWTFFSSHWMEVKWRHAGTRFPKLDRPPLIGSFIIIFFLQFGKKLLRSHSTKVRCAWKTSPSRSVQSWTLHGVNRKKGIEVLRRTVGLAVNRWPVYCCSQRRRESCNSSESARAEREREREVGDIFSEIQRQGCSCPSVVWEIAEAPSEPRFAQFSSCACCLSFPAAALERSCILFVFF